MAKLKKTRVSLHICPTCKGNGYLKISTEDKEETVHQCWDCDSEGEFYVHEPETIFTDNGINLVTDDDVKLH